MKTTKRKRANCDSLDLAAHGECEQGAEVDQEDGPVHGHVGDARQGAQERNDGCLGGRVPELELCRALVRETDLCVCVCARARKRTRKTADERTELFVLGVGREAREEATEALGALCL